MRKLILGVLVVIAALAGYKYWQVSSLIAANSTRVMPPATVSTQIARSSDWRPELSATGNVRAIEEVRMATEVAGVVRRIGFTSGAAVKAGDVLVELDSDEDRARLQSARAKAELAQIKLRRDKELLASGAIAQSRFDETSATATQAQADADALEAMLAKKIIRAPFAGRVSMRDINLGQYLAAGAPVVDLQALDPVFVDFSVAQSQLPQLSVGADVAISIDSRATRPLIGKVTAINPNVDMVTRTVRVRATLPNPDETLRPGMFADVRLAHGPVRQTVIVPTIAVRRAAYGTSMFLVEQTKDKDGKPTWIAHEKFVELGPEVDDRVVVLSGLSAGQRFVIAGLFKLRDGLPVAINNKVLPKIDPGRPPANS